MRLHGIAAAALMFGFASCMSTSTPGVKMFPPRSSIHTGTELTEVWKIYGIWIGSPEPRPPLPDLVREETDGQRTWRTYRYWLEDSGRTQPFLLTFENCKLPNYDEAKQILRSRREEVYRNNPGLRGKVEAFSKKYNLLTEDGRDIALAMFGYMIYDESTVGSTDLVLVRIVLDESSPVPRPVPQRTSAQPTAPSTSLKPDAYGPGIHMNQYGQPVTLRPDFGGVPGERLQMKENAYGPGVHMDQYGRPVREYTWP